MCVFFSFVSNGQGKYLYFDWAIRQKILSGELKYDHDSHTSIADYFGYNGEKEDSLNKYEYDPLTKYFQVDQINTVDDRKTAQKWVTILDFKTIVPALIIKPIINPLLIPSKKPAKKDIADLKKWASVWASVRDSVWASVRASVGDSVRASVRASVGDSVRASVGAYISSFCEIEYDYDFSCCVCLWERGFIPSFDGKIWRLHAGPKAEIVYEWVP